MASLFRGTDSGGARVWRCPEPSEQVDKHAYSRDLRSELAEVFGGIGMDLKEANILITGGTGSFGARLARFLGRQHPRAIRIFSRDEKKQWEMQQAYPQFRYMIGDVRDIVRLEQAMHGIDLVFHAAALKQVPACEEAPFEAVSTNVIGSRNACEAAKAAGVKVFVALSTDKAVKPVNAMGISKAMMERIVCSENQFGRKTVFCCVRYGNVMGSRGSVIPLFRQQLAADEPLTITDPRMTRFLLTLDQSVDLVLHAIKNAKGGEIFVRKAPACTVAQLADTMRRKYGRRGAKHPIKVIGIRPGEKIHEVLVSEYEMRRITEQTRHFTIHPDYAKPHRLAPIRVLEEYTSANTKQLTSYAEIAQLLDGIREIESYL